MRHRYLCVPVLLLGGCLAAQAGDVYKCTSPSGAIAFQDHACAHGDDATIVRLLPPPPDQPLAPPPDDQVAAAPVAAAPPMAAAPGPPQMFLCTRAEDGSHYMSPDGATVERQVPAGVLGIPGKSLANAYGGRNGIGVSAPGVRRIPIDTSPQSALATSYVTVQDECVPASPETTCDYLRAEHDKVHKKLRRAFKDEQAILQPQLDDLDMRMSGC